MWRAGCASTSRRPTWPWSRRSPPPPAAARSPTTWRCGARSGSPARCAPSGAPRRGSARPRGRAFGAACSRPRTRAASPSTGRGPRGSPRSSSSSRCSPWHDVPRPLLAERRAARAVRRPPPARGAPRLRQGRQVVPHLVRGRAHHADGRAQLDLLRPRRGAPLHRPAGDLLHRRDLAAHARPLHAHGRDRTDPGAARHPRRRRLLVLLLRPRACGVLRRRRFDHGLLHPDRLHLDRERGDQRDGVPPPRSGDPAGAHPGDHLGHRGTQHPRHPGERARHLRHLHRGGVRAAQPDRARLAAHGAGQPGRDPGERDQRRALGHRVRAAARRRDRHGRDRELHPRLLGHRVGDPDGRALPELARHLEGVLVPRAHGRHRHAAHLGARPLGAHRLRPARGRPDHALGDGGRQRALRRGGRPGGQRDPGDGGQHRLRRFERAARAGRAPLPLRLAGRDQPAGVALPHPLPERDPLHEHHPAHRGLAGDPRRDVRRQPAGELLHQHRLPAHLPLLPGHEGDPRVPHLARRDARPRAHPGRLLRVPGSAPTLRDGPLGGRGGGAPHHGHSLLAPLRPRGGGGAAQRLPDGDAARARRDGRAARRLLPPPGRDRHRAGGGHERLHHALLPAPADSRPRDAEPLPLPHPGWERVPQHDRDPGPPSGGARRAGGARPLRLADLVVARPPGGGRVRRQPDAAPEAVPEAHLLDRRGRAHGRPRRGHGGRGSGRRLVTFLVLFWLNLGLLAFFVVLLQRPNLLSFAKGGRWYLTWFAIGLITLMDELTSIFYVPAEAHRFIGARAIFFIAITSLLMRVLSTRMVEIAQILERHDLRGGGVYSFSYFVLGPVASFVAVASIMVDYILTASISTVSAVYNGTAFLPMGPAAQYVMIFAAIWAVAGLNILGIRENARVTFVIFIVAAVVLLNLIALGVLHIDPQSPHVIYESGASVVREVSHHGLPHALATLTTGVAFCVLAYSGIESVIQTAGLAESWRDISKASQGILADMYAIGLLASFCINIGCLLIYRYFQGTKEIRDYHTSRAGTLALETILLACFVYLALHKPYGVALWGGVVTVLLCLGIPLSRRYGPEVEEVRRCDYPMEMLLAPGATAGPVDAYFRRPGALDVENRSPNAAFVTFFSPRQPIPEKLAPNHYRFPIQGGSVYRSIRAILALLAEELEGRRVHVHFGWPTSSWLDRMAVGVFVASLMRLPKAFPKLVFSMDYNGPAAPPAGAAAPGERVAGS